MKTSIKVFNNTLNKVEKICKALNLDKQRKTKGRKLVLIKEEIK